MQDKSTTKTDIEPVLGVGEMPAGVLGWLRAEWSAKGLRRLDFRDAPAQDIDHALIPREYARVLSAYLRGEDVDPLCLPVDPVGTPFQQRVWTALRQIPKGVVCSYSAIANAIESPRAMRAVGSANGKNPVSIVIPCHRVVAAGYHLGGYTGGLDRKRFLLQLEGVKLNADRVLPGQLDLFASA